MRRTIVLVLICLILGAVANYAVALLISYHADPSTGTYKGSIQQRGYQPWFHEVPEEWPQLVTGSFLLRKPWHVVGFEYSSTQRLPRAFQTDIVYHCASTEAGWPLRSLRSLAYIELNLPKGTEVKPAGLSSRAGYEYPFREDRQRFLGSNATCYLPLAPIWSAFAINTLLYALPPALIIATWTAIKRRRRTAEGACSNCGYDLAGIDAGVCPECGKGAVGA